LNNYASGDWTGLSDANIVDLFRGKVYLNIHSSTEPGGEIRGDLSFSEGMMTAVLDGAQAGTASTAKGTAWVEFEDDSVYYQITIAGLQGTFSMSHFHVLPSGSVVQGITFTDSSAHGYWVPGQQMLDLIKGNIYINVHSSLFTGGEIRGTLRLGSGVPTAVRNENSGTVPDEFSLAQNYPNPFNPSTTIKYRIDGKVQVTLKVFDLLGREVATLVNEEQPAGEHRAVFNASRFSSGIYFYQLHSGGRTLTNKMMLLK
jgi:hypothetical protein